jgi:hypothetical protein
LIIFDVDAHVSGTLVFVSPLNEFGCIDNVALWQVTTIPTINHFLEEHDYANEPQGQPAFPIITQHMNNPYVGKSCMLKIHIDLNLNLSPKITSKAWTPTHNI